MLRYIADEELPYRVTLVYSNRDRESAAFLDELEELERRIDGLRVVLTMTDEDGMGGRDSPDRCRVLGELSAGSRASRYLVAGPPAMAEAVAARCSAPACPRIACSADKFRAT